MATLKKLCKFQEVTTKIYLSQLKSALYFLPDKQSC